MSSSELFGNKWTNFMYISNIARLYFTAVLSNSVQDIARKAHGRYISNPRTADSKFEFTYFSNALRQCLKNSINSKTATEVPVNQLTQILSSVRNELGYCLGVCKIINVDHMWIIQATIKALRAPVYALQIALRCTSSYIVRIIVQNCKRNIFIIGFCCAFHQNKI